MRYILPPDAWWPTLNVTCFYDKAHSVSDVRRYCALQKSHFGQFLGTLNVTWAQLLGGFGVCYLELFRWLQKEKQLENGHIEQKIRKFNFSNMALHNFAQLRTIMHVLTNSHFAQLGTIMRCARNPPPPNMFHILMWWHKCIWCHTWVGLC